MLPSPDEQVVDARIGYASHLYRADRSWFGGTGLFILATPQTPTGASVLPVEDGELRCGGLRSVHVGRTRLIPATAITEYVALLEREAAALGRASLVRAEEVRALRWRDVDLLGDPEATPPVPPSVSVLRSVRQTGDTKTPRSRRRLAIAGRVVDALASRRATLVAPPAPDALAFGTRNGTELDRHNVLRAFRRVVDAAGLDPDAWTPRELRHSFVSLLSQSGMRIEDISRLVGHSGTAITERVYRHEMRPVLQEGAAVMDALFGERPQP